MISSEDDSAGADLPLFCNPDQAEKRQPANFASLGLLANRGIAFEGLYDWDSAAATYSLSIEKSQALGYDEPYVLNSRGNCYASLGKWELALADYESATKAFQTMRNLSGMIYADSNHALVLAEIGRRAA